MREFFQKLLDSEFMPHGGCYFWEPDILWLHAASDALIALSYYSIPAALWYFVRKRGDLRFRWIFVLFGVFIFACGTTHLMSLWTTWNATYRLEGVIKLVTALVSVVTAVLLWPLIPKALALPSPEELAASKRALQDEMRERRLAERRARLHLERLAHVDRVNTLGEMAASLGHELHQPLGAIVNFARGCERALTADESPEDLKRILRKISTQAERAAEIVRRTRDFSSHQKLQRQPTEVNVLLHEVAELLEALTRRFKVEIHFDLPEDLPLLLVDRIQLQQVIANLVKNGIEAMREVEPEQRLLELRSRRDADRVVLEVADRGCGAAAEPLEQLFEPFYSTKKGGMGMGLSISRSIVEAHGGTLAAETRSGPGLLFRLELPIPQSELTAPDAEQE